MGIKTKISILFLISAVAVALFSGIIANAAQHEAETTSVVSQTSSKIELVGVDICFECHDPEQTLGFHYPDTIMGIEEFKGIRRRICVDCHGPQGTDPDSPMTAESKIKWVEEKGHFRLSSDVPHGIHANKLESGAMACETCHLIKDGDPTQLGIELATPIPGQGQILVCEMCHLPSTPGNYINVHIFSGHQVCNTCHTGEMKDIHKRATGKLGRTS